MTRLWVAGIRIKVFLNPGGLPQQGHWGGRTHPVQEVVHHWRVDAGWWRLRIWRDYYKLVTTTGLLVVVYHDLVRDEWFLQRIYD